MEYENRKSRFGKCSMNLSQATERQNFVLLRGRPWIKSKFSFLLFWGLLRPLCSLMHIRRFQEDKIQVSCPLLKQRSSSYLKCFG
jgi:hypothetical protein